MAGSRERWARAAKQFGEGFRSEGGIALGEAREALALARRNFDRDPEVRDTHRAETARLVRHVRENPRPVLREVASTVAAPIRAEIAQGRPAAAAGRAAVLLAGLVLPGAGAEKFIRVVDASEAEPRRDAHGADR